MRGREETQRERSMVDLRADTASSSDKAEVTETEDQSRTHQSGPSQSSPTQGRGQMDLLNVPSRDGADMRSRQDVQALSALSTSSGDR